MDKKKVYAVLWVDDYGALKLRKRDVDWYHRNAGPISYAVECDDRFPWGFSVAFSSLSRALAAGDYFSHHVHPLRYTGAKAPKRVYDLLRLHYALWSLLRGIPRRVPKDVFRSVLVLGLGGVAAIAVYLFYVNTPAFIALGIPYLAGTLLIALWYYIQLPRHWEDTYADSERIIKSIVKAQAEFERRGLAYPKVVRHGWNLPWQGSIKFYLKSNVVADASAVPYGADRHPKIGEREINWRLSQPYFTSAAHDYDVAWDGTDKGDKGLIELPVNLGNISAYGFGEHSKMMIERVPAGGLVSCYIHPHDDFSPIRDWVRHLKAYYDVQFVSAETASEIYESEL
jgi:hypothetical protein